MSAKTLVLTTTKSDDVTASYKFRSLKHFYNRDFKPSNERVQTDERQCIADLPNNMRVIPR